MNRWIGPSAFVLALSVGVTLATALIILSLHPVASDSQLESILTTLAGAAVGAVATFLGTTVSKTGSATAGQQQPEEHPGGQAGDGDEQPVLPHDPAG